jgi:hypothetical protein
MVKRNEHEKAIAQEKEEWSDYTINVEEQNRGVHTP